jgi:hypothetical protein
MLGHGHLLTPNNSKSQTPKSLKIRYWAVPTVYMVYLVDGTKNLIFRGL